MSDDTVKTDKKKNKKKSKWTYYNKRRRDRYKENSEYRQKAREQSLQAYRKQNNIELTNCGVSLDYIDTIKERHIVTTEDGYVFNAYVFSLNQTAALLDKNYPTLWRWVDRGIVPKPIFYRVEGKKEAVFHISEVRALIEEISEHEKKYKYFTKKSVYTIRNIENRLNRVRTRILKNR